MNEKNMTEIYHRNIITQHNQVIETQYENKITQHKQIHEIRHRNTTAQRRAPEGIMAGMSC